MRSLFQSISDWFPRLGRHQARAPFLYALVSVLTILASVYPVMGLRLNGDLTALLPQWMQSVKDLNEISQRFGQPATLGVLIHSPDEKRNQAFVRALAPRLGKLQSNGVISADWSIGDYQSFAEKYKYLYVPVEDLQKLTELIEDRLDYEKQKHNPLFVDVNGPNDDLEKEIDRLKGKAKEKQAATRFRDGFFSSNPQYYAIILRTTIGGGQGGRILALTRAIDQEVAAVRAELKEPLEHKPTDLTVDYGGGVMDMYAEQEALQDAAIAATLVTLALVGGAILVFFRRWTSIPVMFLGILPPIALTFAISRLFIDYLNASSAFLTSIVIGNGINPHIIWLARYLEARRSGKGLEDATAEAHRTAWPGTLSASLGATVAYSALVVTDFRAFRDFGIIGGVGMVTCWFATFLVTPVVANAFERRFPTKPMKTEDSNIYGRAVAWLAFGAPRLIVAASLVLTATSAVVIYKWAKQSPIEYDFRKLGSERKDSHLSEVGEKLAGCTDASSGGNGIAVLSKTPADLPSVRQTLADYSQAHPGVLGSVHSIEELLPPEQDKKVPLLQKLRTQMLDARKYLKDEKQQKELDEFMPPEKVVALAPADLPEMVARPYTELTGVRGTVLYVEQAPGTNQFDGKYLTAWTAGVRAARNRDGSRAAVAGAAPVVADLVDAIGESGPKTVKVSFFATFLLLFFTFTGLRDRFFTFVTHVFGVTWMIGCMAFFKVKVNFLNFIALPVTFGLGIDYGVNVMRRFVEEERAGHDTDTSIRAAVHHTGGAVILCSLTTMIGYLALFTSPNQAVNSFGIAMSLAEITCLVSAVVVLPAVLIVVASSRRPNGK